MCRMELMPRTGTAPFILVDNRHGANQTPSSHVANISPPKCLHSVRAAWNDLQTLLGGSFSSGHRLSSVRLVTQSLRESVKSSLHQSERALGCLILITAIHHVRNSLPPHVCFDLLLSSTVTVKDEGPCGRAGTGPWKPVPARSCVNRPRPQLAAPYRGWEK